MGPDLNGKGLVKNHTIGSDCRLSDNVGGFGAGVWAPEFPDQDVPPSILAEAFAADGMAVWQQRYIPRDDPIF